MCSHSDTSHFEAQNLNLPLRPFMNRCVLLNRTAPFGSYLTEWARRLKVKMCHYYPSDVCYCSESDGPETRQRPKLRAKSFWGPFNSGEKSQRRRVSLQKVDLAQNAESKARPRHWVHGLLLPYVVLSSRSFPRPLSVGWDGLLRTQRLLLQQCVWKTKKPTSCAVCLVFSLFWGFWGGASSLQRFD